MTNTSSQGLTWTDSHAHTSRCWWDHTQARWVCPPAAPTGTVADAVREVDTARVDTRDMVVVHTAMLREFRLLPGAVEAVADGDTKRAAVVDGHLGLLCDLLHHHHSGEDDLLWPVLAPRLAKQEVALLDVAEAQHAGIEQALDAVADARAAWAGTADPEARDALASALRALHVLLTEHLEAEERHLLPLAASHLTEAEWGAVGAAGAASVPKSAMPLVIGMFAYEGDPEVICSMLAAAPLVPRVLVPLLGPRVYARRARAVYGTPTP